ncbi:MAG: hypothetical protein WCK35_06980 [Chloroflexota bacterium]
MQIRTPENPTLPPPPGAIKALVSGFNAIAGNVAVILFPAALDLFLWLGPRLKADALFAPIFEALPDIQAQASVEQAKILTQFVNDFSNGLNLFSVIRTFPLGIFSLMSTNISITAPLGTRMAISLPGWLAALGAMLGITIIGWLAGSLYFRAVSRVALKITEEPGIARVLLHGGLLSAVWMLLFAFGNLPLVLIMWLLAVLNSTVRTFLFILLSLPAAWILMVIYYSFFGIFAKAQNAYASTRNSIRMLRFGLPPLGWFTTMVLIISQGMDMLWRAAPTDSWMTGVGILGHAFVSTSLLAASFIYYRDLSTWIETALLWLNKQNKPSAQA